MADPPPRIGFDIGLPPDDTARAFDARSQGPDQGLRITARWSEMMHDEHARAFTVAHLARLDLLEDIRTSLADVIHNGGTFEQWRANIQPILERAGWWGRVEDRSLTGADHAIHVGPRRLETIYRTNLRVSRAAGQWARIRELADVAPFLRYSAVMDDRTRPAHRRWHGTILRWDDAWWDTHFPPCGWNCRCTVIQLSQRDLARRGWQVSKAPPKDLRPARPFQPAGAAEPVLVPDGIDPGWAYNPGKASLRGVATKAIETLEHTAAHDLPAARAALAEIVSANGAFFALEEPDTAFPVMILGDEEKTAIGAAARVVTLVHEAIEHQISKQRDFARDVYRQLAGMEVRAPIAAVVEDLLLFAQESGPRWLAVSIRAPEGTPFVSAVEVMREAALDRRLVTATILRDRAMLPAADDVAAFAERAIDDRQFNRALQLGRAGQADPAEVRGLRRELPAERVRHVENFHFEGGIRADRFPVTQDDLLLIPKIIRDGVSSFKARPPDRGGSIVRHALKIGDLWYVYIERASFKRARLAPATFYKTQKRPVWATEGGEG